jgi:hypothetical protein
VKDMNNTEKALHVAALIVILFLVGFFGRRILGPTIVANNPSEYVKGCMAAGKSQDECESMESRWVPKSTYVPVFVPFRAR